MSDSEPAPSALDFSTYELEGLRCDVKAIVTPRGAIGGVAKWGLGIPVAVCLVVWLVFMSRIDSSLVLVAFSVLAGLLAVPAGVLVGGWRVAGKRLDNVTLATGRIVDVVGEMHTDIVKLHQGHAETSVRQVAVGLLEEAVFPVVFGSVTTVAEGVLGPAGFLADKAARGPMKLVERSVIAAIEGLPDRQIGQLSAGAAEAVDLNQRVNHVCDEYQVVRGRMTGVVDRVGHTSRRIAISATFAATLPLVVWLIIGWLAS